MIGRKPPAEGAIAVANARRQLPGTVGLLGRILAEVLDCAGGVAIQFEMIGHAGGDVDGGANGIAGVARCERAIEHVDAADILGRRNAEMRRGGAVVVADGRVDHDPVDEDQVARRRAQAGGAGGDRVLGIAVMALTHDQGRRIFQHVLGVGIDLLISLGSADLDIAGCRVDAARVVGGYDDIFGLEPGADGLGMCRACGKQKGGNRSGGAKARGSGHGKSPITIERCAQLCAR